jgi:hypothetical protein
VLNLLKRGDGHFFTGLHTAHEQVGKC